MNYLKKSFQKTKDDLKSLFAGNPDLLNLNSLVGRTPFWKSLLFSLTHLVAMFASDVIPLLIVFAYLKLDAVDAILGALFIAGLTTMIQSLFGARLPLVYGSSFAFVSVFLSVASSVIASGGTPETAYYTILCSSIIGSLSASLLALFYPFWRKIIKPIVPALVVLGIGLSLLETGATSFFGGEGILTATNDVLPLYAYLLVALFTLVVMILWTVFAKGIYKNLSVAVALVAGYVLACCIPGMVDFSSFAMDFNHLIGSKGLLYSPRLIDFSKLNFELMPTILVTLVYFVSEIEALGSYNAISSTTVGGDPRPEDCTRGLFGMSLAGSVGACFGAFPLTVFAGNVSLSISSQVINRFVTIIAGGILILMSFFPPLANFIISIPDCVMGGIMLSLFGSIALVGMEMLLGLKRSRKNNLIISIALTLGFGISLSSSIKGYFTSHGISDVYNLISSPILGMFVVGILLSWILPDDLGAKKKSKKDGTAENKKGEVKTAEETEAPLADSK